MKTVKEFYEDLFTSRGVSKTEEELLLGQIKTKVTEQDIKMCDEGIREEEIEQAITQLNTGKSPGTDGLTNEFYKKFKALLVPVLLMRFFNNKELSETMKMVMIKLIYNKKGSTENLKNFRPVTMVNTDYKILAKVLANRLKKVLHQIITTT